MTTRSRKGRWSCISTRLHLRAGATFRRWSGREDRRYNWGYEPEGKRREDFERRSAGVGYPEIASS